MPRRHKVKIGTDEVPTIPDTTVLDINFDDWALGTPTTTLWNSKFGNGASSTQLNNFVTIVDNPLGGRMLRTTVQSGSTGTASGTTMSIDLPSGITKATMTYRVRFTGQVDGGAWIMTEGGGKLPGLGGETPDSTAEPTGGTYPADKGFSGRLMWVTKAPKVNRGNGEGLLYYYGYDQKLTVTPNAFGDEAFWGTTNVFLPGTWYDIKIVYELNSVGQSNGRIRVYRDNVLMVDYNNKQTRTRSDLEINRLYWSIFIGGGSSTWWISEDSWIDIDNFKITKQG